MKKPFYPSIIQFYFSILFFFLCTTTDATPRTGNCTGDCQNGKGTFRYENSLDEYEGSFQDGLFHGYGILKLHRGTSVQDKKFDVYEGMFVRDKMSGDGIYKFSNGDILSGNFSDNKLNGVGTARNGFLDKDLGSYYSGHFLNNRFHGFGYYKYPDGSYYVGEFADGKMSGIGVMRKGDLYTFIDGYDRQSRPEKSIVYTMNKDFYFQIEKTQKRKESLIQLDSLLYGGEMENGKFSGIGFCTLNSKKIYFGEWSQNQFNGTGIYIHPNGTIYIGNFLENKMNGLGVKFDKDGDLIYSGEWEMGKRK